jgi:hypothetical protein
MSVPIHRRCIWWPCLILQHWLWLNRGHAFRLWLNMLSVHGMCDGVILVHSALLGSNGSNCSPCHSTGKANILMICAAPQTHATNGWPKPTPIQASGSYMESRPPLHDSPALALPTGCQAVRMAIIHTLLIFTYIITTCRRCPDITMCRPCVGVHMHMLISGQAHLVHVKFCNGQDSAGSAWWGTLANIGVRLFGQQLHSTSMAG